MVDELYECVFLNGDRKIFFIVISLIMDRYLFFFEKDYYQNMIDLDQFCDEDLKEILEFYME